MSQSFVEGQNEEPPLPDYREIMTQNAYQYRVFKWLLKCFGAEISRDKSERNYRFLEESLELVQACDCTAEEAHRLVEYVFNRPVGEKFQEVGGVMVTLASLCHAQGIHMGNAAETELKRILDPEVMNKIRAKQATKPNPY